MSERHRATPRSVALEAVERVASHGAYSTIVIPAALRRSGLGSADRNLAAELAYGTLRRTIPIDRVLSSKVDRPLSHASDRALALLRLGTYQLRFMRIPAHAAVSETVALAGPRERGFVNAVLRRVSAEPASWPTGDTDDAISVRTGVAAWAVAELRRLLGDETEAAAAALAQRAPLTLRTNTCRTTVDDLRAALVDAGLRPAPGRVDPGSLLLDGGSPPDLPGFREGWFAVQDQASAFVVQALAPEPGDRVLDVCAAPGGKSGHIACLVGEGGRLVAGDASASRVVLVRDQLRRLGLPGLVLAQDARAPAVDATFDRILVDAPCSGIGSARRRPELLWRPRKEELSSLARLQVAIASSSASLLAPGGRLVYSVCTFPRAETDAACDAILRRRPDLEPVSIDGPDGPTERVRLWPHRHGADAMFVAAFRRTA